MKKINLLVMVVAGVFTVACNGGGSSGSGGGGNTVDACANGAATCGAPSAVTAYSQPIQSGGNLLSTTGIYVSAGSTTVPIPFTVNGITQDTVVTFTVAQSTSTTNKLKNSTVLPTLSSDSCTFNAASPQPCSLNMDFSGVSNGAYTITPSVGGQSMSPITITSMAASSFTLPLGTYSVSVPTFTIVLNDTGFERCYANYDFPVQTMVNTLTGVYTCIADFAQCIQVDIPGTNTLSRFPEVNLPSNIFNVPASNMSPAYSSYFTNSGWNNNVFSTTQSISPVQCSGVFVNQEWTLQSSSTILPYPIANQNTSNTKNVNKINVGLFGEFTH